MEIRTVTVIGGGLAGCEAAFQAARAGVPVTLVEMRPARMTPAHTTGDLAELVCSNSLRSNELRTAAGLLKQELRSLGSLLLEVADLVRVPAGGALAVSRAEFARGVTARMEGQPGVRILREEAVGVPLEGVAVLATGPLTSPAMEAALADMVGPAFLRFYDAIAPVVAADSVDPARVFRASRYDKGGGADYVNCPLDRDEYLRLREAILTAEKVPLRPFEEPRFFERCLPIEELAARGEDTLRFGPMKPVGLRDPATGKRPYAVLQLRQDDLAGAHVNLVGFQTRMKHPEQDRVLRLVPALREARFVRYGQVHRNSYIDAPRLVRPTTELAARPGIFIAGQVSGVEGYIESIASGLVAGLNAARRARGLEPAAAPAETLVGALLAAVSDPRQKTFQPVKISFGILPGAEPPRGVGRIRHREALAERSMEALLRYHNAVRSDPRVS